MEYSLLVLELTRKRGEELPGVQLHARGATPSDRRKYVVLE